MGDGRETYAVAMKREPLVSIVTPTRNMATFLRDAITSVATQRYARVEHIVVDGASHDATVELLKNASASDKRLSWISEPDAGQADAIQKGFRLARGEIIAWLNADDVYVTPDAVSLVVEAFARRPSTAVVTAGGKFIDRAGMPFRIIPPPRGFTIEQLRRCDVLLQPATFFRRSVVSAVPLDTSLDFAFDWDFFVRVLHGREVVVLDALLAGYRMYGENKTSVGGSRRTFELAEVTGRYLGRRSWQFAVLRSAAELDRAIDRMPFQTQSILRRALYGGALRAAHHMSRGALQI